MHGGELFASVLQASWQASVGIVLLLIGRSVAGRFLSGRWLYLLWMVVMARLLLPGSLLPSSPAHVPQPAALARTNWKMGPTPDELPPVIGTLETVAQQGNVQVRTTREIHERRAKPVDWRKAAVAVWLAGAGLLALYFGGASIWLRRRIVDGLHSTPELVERQWQECRKRFAAPRLTLLTSEAVRAPLLFGLIQPKLVLPYGCRLDALLPADWEHIFTHELAHHRRWDTWSNLLPLAALCVHWFNPLAWLCQRAIRADRELATDEDVLRLLGEERRDGYAQTLLRLLASGGGSHPLPGAIGIVESGTGIKRRFRRILEFRARRIAVTVLGVLAVCSLALITFGQEKKAPEATKPNDGSPTFTSLQDMKGQILAAARTGDNKRIAEIQVAAADRNMPFKSEDAGELLERLIEERDLKTFTFLLENLRRSHAGIDWQPGKEALEKLLKDDRRDFLETLLSHRLKLDLLTPEVMKAAGANQPWIEKRVAEVRQQRSNENLLVQACRTGDIVTMTRLLDAGVDVDCVASNDFTPLTRAAVSGQAAAVKLLLSRGAMVDKPRLPGWDYTALCLANTVEVAQLLKDAGANVNATLFDRPEPIITYPARWAKAEVVKWFLDQGVDAKNAHFDDPTLLFSAGRPETAELLIQRGVDVNAIDKNGESALFQIIRYTKNPAKIAEVLLAHGANPNVRNRYGQTPLMVAPDGPTVEALIAAGADVNAKDDRGGSVLQFFGVKAEPSREEALRRHGAKSASPNENIEILKRTILSNDLAQAKSLLARGVDPDASSMGFQQYPEPSAMALAADFGCFEIVNAMRAAGGKDVGLLSQAAAEGDTGKMKQLLKDGAKVDEQTGFGDTPLSFAVRRGQLEAVRLLLDEGADPAHFNRCGVTPLALAEFMVLQWKAQGSSTVRQTKLSAEDEEAFYPKAVALMVPHAPAKEPVNAVGETALTCASAYGNTMAAMSLVQRGADVNYQRPDGMTPLMIAIVTKPRDASQKMVTRIDPKTGEKHESSLAASYVEFLLGKGAKLDLRNHEGKTALDLAQERNDTEITALLLADKTKATTQTP